MNKKKGKKEERELATYQDVILITKCVAPVDHPSWV